VSGCGDTDYGDWTRHKEEFTKLAEVDLAAGHCPAADLRMELDLLK